jgi:formylglycine-generating enzyme required for sulfatase activity
MIDRRCLNECARALGFAVAMAAAGCAVSGCTVIEGPDPIARTQPFATVDGAGEAHVAIEYASIPSGTFVMGSPSDEEGREEREGPQHDVSVSAFELSRYEVTVGQYTLFLREHPSVALPENWRDDLASNEPATGMTWHEAATFARWAGGRLPSEAEWEYGARAGTTGPRYGELDEIAWVDSNSGIAMRAVGDKQSNAWGLYDMLGNVYEWCADWYEPYTAEPQTDPKGAAQGGRRVVKGGSFADDGQFARAAYRSVDDPGLRAGDYGFRVARDAK